jgi:hypothetical protein
MLWMQSTPSIYHPPARRNCPSLIGGNLLCALTGLRCCCLKPWLCHVRTCLRHSHTLTIYVHVCDIRTYLPYTHIFAIYKGGACTGWQWRPYHQQNLHGKVRILVEVSPTHCQPAHVLPLDAHLCDIRTSLRYTHIFATYAHLSLAFKR